jgi:hypothetical protein
MQNCHLIFYFLKQRPDIFHLDVQQKLAPVVSANQGQSISNTFERLKHKCYATAPHQYKFFHFFLKNRRQR